MKAFALIGSPRVGNTFKLCEIFLKKLQEKIPIEYEIKRIEDFEIKYCKGCGNCIMGKNCPINDDFKEVIDKIKSSDLFIFASPVYAENVSAQTKTFIDRNCGSFHFPPFIGKYAIVASTTAYHGLRNVLMILRESVVGWGMNCIGEISAIFWGNKMKDEEKVLKRIDKIAEDTAKILNNEKEFSPSLFDLMMFESMKMGAIHSKYWNKAEYDFWKEKGLFEQKYYSRDVKVSYLKVMLAKLSIFFYYTFKGYK